MEGRRKRGFTLIELLTILILVAVLAMMAVPAWQKLVQGARIGTWQRQLHGALNYTRTHAIFSATPTVICARAAGGGCATSGGSWDNGWLVFEDPAGTGDCQPGPQARLCANTGQPILRMQQGTDAVRIVNNSNVARRVRYNIQGLSYGYTGRFTVCSGSAAEARGLVIANTGRIRSASPGELLPCSQG